MDVRVTFLDFRIGLSNIPISEFLNRYPQQSLWNI
jgi:hypothetical protein